MPLLQPGDPRGPSVGEILANPDQYPEDFERLKEKLAPAIDEAANKLRQTVGLIYREAPTPSRHGPIVNSLHSDFLSTAVHIPPRSENPAQLRRLANEVRGLRGEVAELRSALQPPPRPEPISADEAFVQLAHEAFAENDVLREKIAALESLIRAMRVAALMKEPTEDYPDLTEDDFSEN